MQTDADGSGGVLGRALRRVADVRTEEVAALGWSAALFFCLFTAYAILKPIREAMGIARGVDDLPFIWIGTLAFTIALNPFLSLLVARFPRERFVPIAYRFFAGNLLLFFVAFQMLPEGEHVAAGYVFYVWLSGFNLFAFSLFWGFMADLFGPASGKRLFGLLALGATVGSMLGAKLTSILVEPLGIPGLLLLSLVLLEASVQSFHRATRTHFARAPRTAASRDAAPPAERPAALDGMARVVRSPYLLGLVLLVGCLTLSAGFVYFEQGRIIEASSPDRETRTRTFAEIDFWANAVTLVLQSLLAGRLLTRFGAGPCLLVLPLVTLGGFIALRDSPTLATLVLFQVARRGMNYGLTKPAGEVLFTTLPREEKYAAKNLIDTFFYRGGDVVSAALYAAVVLPSTDRATTALAIVAPVAIVWMAAALLLGRAHERRARAAA